MHSGNYLINYDVGTNLRRTCQVIRSNIRCRSSGVLQVSALKAAEILALKRLNFEENLVSIKFGVEKTSFLNET